MCEKLYIVVANFRFIFGNTDLVRKLHCDTWPFLYTILWFVLFRSLFAHFKISLTYTSCKVAVFNIDASWRSIYVVSFLNPATLSKQDNVFAVSKTNCRCSQYTCFSFGWVQSVELRALGHTRVLQGYLITFSNVSTCSDFIRKSKQKQKNIFPVSFGHFIWL